MEAGMSSEKFLAIMTSIREAKSVASEMTLPPDSRPNVQKLHLLRLLDRVQQLIVALRADFIDWVYFRSPDEARNPTPADRLATADHSSNEPVVEREAKVFLFDRRRTRTDRRGMHTFLARDQRSGIADRRRRRPKPGVSIRAWHAQP
jgi:hypothetical protein